MTNEQVCRRPDPDLRGAGKRWVGVMIAFALLLVAARHAVGQVGGLDGQKDIVWGQDGSLLIDAGPGQISLGDMLIQPDGKLLLAGQCDQHACTVRLRPNGSPDTLYGPGGIGLVKHESLPIWGRVRARLLSNGRILLAGETTEGFVVVARLLPDGSIDDSAGAGDGYHVFDFHGGEGSFGSSGLFDMVVLQDGKILVTGAAGSQRHGEYNVDMAVARLLVDLSGLDSSFGGGDGLSPAGTKIVPFDLNGPSSPKDNRDEATAIHVYPDGGVLLAGSVQAPAPQRFRAALVRLQAGGAFDQSFGDGGKIVFQSGVAGQHRLGDVAVDRQGRIVVAGHVSDDNDYGNMLAARRLTNGQVDTSFGLDGFAMVSFNLTANSPDFANRLVLQSDGKILLGGYAYNTFATRLFAVARLREDGLPDPSFGVSGKSADRYAQPAVPNVNPGDAVDVIAIGNGGVMVAGAARTSGNATRVGIARLTLDRVFTDGFQR